MEARRDSPLRTLGDRPGTLNQLKRLGNAIRDDDAPAIRGLHYDEVWSWYNELVAAIVTDIQDLRLERLLRNPSSLDVTGRAKVRSTVREKLLRSRAEKLPSLQDLAGVRIEADMTLTEQDALARTISARFGQGPTAIHDLRDGTHAGYRGVHIWVRLNQPRGAWFEIQVRTKAQGAWANMYEALADFIGRDIRYGYLPVVDAVREAVVKIQEVSRDQLSVVERECDRLVHQQLAPDDANDAVRSILAAHGVGPQDVEQTMAKVKELGNGSADAVVTAMTGTFIKVFEEQASGLRSIIQEGGQLDVELRRDL